MNVLIYQPTKNAMQSGRAKTARWVLEYETETPRQPEPLMGWVSSGDTLNQVKIFFDTRDEAVSFAQKKGWSYSVTVPQARKVKPRSYVDNFRYTPPEEKAG